MITDTGFIIVIIVLGLALVVSIISYFYYDSKVERLQKLTLDILSHGGVSSWMNLHSLKTMDDFYTYAKVVYNIDMKSNKE